MRWRVSTTFSLWFVAGACDVLIGLDAYENGVASGTVAGSTSATTGSAGNAGAPGAGGQGGALGYADLVLEDAPMGYWRLGERNAAGSALDETIFGRDGSYQSVMLGQSALIADELDTAAGFGDGSGVIMTPDFHFAPKQSFTVELWFRPDTLDQTFRHLVGQRIAPSGELGWSVGTYGGTLRMRRANQPDALSWDSVVDIPGALSVGNTYFIVATYDASTGDLCLELRPGQRVCKSSTFALTQAAIELAIWVYGAGSGGTIDELAIYNHVLASDRIEAHHLAGLGR